MLKWNPKLLWKLFVVLFIHYKKIRNFHLFRRVGPRKRGEAGGRIYAPNKIKDLLPRKSLSISGWIKNRQCIDLSTFFLSWWIWLFFFWKFETFSESNVWGCKSLGPSEGFSVRVDSQLDNLGKKKMLFLMYYFYKSLFTVNFNSYYL